MYPNYTTPPEYAYPARGPLRSPDIYTGAHSTFDVLVPADDFKVQSQVLRFLQVLVKDGVWLIGFSIEDLLMDNWDLIGYEFD